MGFVPGQLSRTLLTIVQYPGENDSLSLSSAGPRPAREWRVGLPWGYITRPVLSPSANQGERASVLLHAWECENWGASIGRWRWECVAAPTILTSALRACGARWGSRITPWSKKLMLWGHRRPILPDLRPTAALTRNDIPIV